MIHSGPFSRKLSMNWYLGTQGHPLKFQSENSIQFTILCYIDGGHRPTQIRSFVLSCS